MTKLHAPAAAAVALLALAACKPEVQEVDSRAPDPMASALANAAPIELPPAISATVTFRCQPGNKLVFVDFFQGEKMANVRTDKSERPTTLKAPEAGQPYVAEGGYKLTGNADGATVELPGSGALTCKA